MGLFSLFKKNKKNNPKEYSEVGNAVLSATLESVTAYEIIKAEKQENGEQIKRNIVFQPEHVTIKANRVTMTKGYPADYFFSGDEKNESAELPLLSPLKIDVEKAVREGVAGKRPWEGSKCFFVAENEEYRFYNYGCYADGSGGCTIGNKQSDAKKVLFFGKAGSNTCIFHNKLVQIDNSSYGTDLFLYVKDISTGNEKIYPWFGKYAIPTGRGSRYNQDKILNMRVDTVSDAIIIEVQREYYVNPSPEDNERLCNADTKYVMTIRAKEDDFQAIAEFPELNISVVFNVDD